MISVVWFRRDLRVTDNSALFHAAKASTGGVIGLFIATPQQWKEHDDADCKVRFWLDSLTELSTDLEKLNIPLRIEIRDRFDDVPRLITSFAQEHDCRAVYFNREYEVNERRRDEQVAEACGQLDIAVHQFHDRIIVPPRGITTGEGQFYKVFTPYRRVWNELAMESAEVLAKPAKPSALKLKPSKIPQSLPGFDLDSGRHDLWPPGEKEAQRRLQKFTKKIDSYGEARDVPSLSGTSLLSPMLAAGVISPRQCLTSALAANQGKIDNAAGPTTWISELTWRDFYTHVMIGFPRVSMGQPFKQKTEAIPWRAEEQEFEAWKSGQTGYPIVDAGMRQLNQTGWMHNRLRMVTAMFLTKHLLIDWRWGEKYFMRKLIDGDLAANNGGWQWSASTGTDAVPYFRIFNPFSQSKRFDPDGQFIKKLVPELKDVPAAKLHDPKKLVSAIQAAKLPYPKPIVDHSTARKRALETFSSLD